LCQDNQLDCNWIKKHGNKKTDKMNCTDAFKNKIKGDFGSPDFRFIQISLKPCKEKEGSKVVCAKPEAATKFFSNPGN
jgi:hypothetical protein